MSNAQIEVFGNAEKLRKKRTKEAEASSADLVSEQTGKPLLHLYAVTSL